MTRLHIRVLRFSHYSLRIRLKGSRSKLVIRHIAVLLPCALQCWTLAVAQSESVLMIRANQTVQSLSPLSGGNVGQLNALTHRSDDRSELLAVASPLATFSREPRNDGSHSAPAEETCDKSC